MSRLHLPHPRVSAVLLLAALLVLFGPDSFFAPIVAFASAPARSSAPTQRTIRVEAANFAFSPAVLRVNPGDQITIELVAKDVAHGLSIDGYPVDLTAEPGHTERVSFVADRAGSFKFRCSLACGNLHPFMTGKFEVGPNLMLYRALALGLLVFLLGVFNRRG